MSDIVLYALKASCSLLHSARLLSALLSGCGIKKYYYFYNDQLHLPLAKNDEACYF